MERTIKIFLAILILFFETVCVQAQPPQLPTGAQTPGKIEKILHVSLQNPQASDQNPGTEQQPLKTLKEATAKAVDNKRKGTGTKVVIHPGTYREQLIVPTDYNDRNNLTPLVFEASEKHGAIITGSDAWTQWARRGNTDIYTHKWPHNWGTAPIPNDIPSPWRDSLEKKPISRRREMIFIDGKWMRPVLSQKDLVAGSFYVDEASDTVYLRPPAGINPTKAVVEVALRPSVIFAEFARNVTFRGLVFQHVNSSMNPNHYNPENGHRDTNKINNSSDILLEDNRFVWNNTDGIGFTASSNITCRGNIANHNGSSGMGAFRLKNILFEGNETSYNNWRGDMSDFRDWSVAGLKFLLVHDGMFRRHVSTSNFARGFWFDADHINVTLEDSCLTKNLVGGIFIEANWGPIILRNNVISENDGPGILTSAVNNLTLVNNILYHNKESQILVSGDAGGRTMSNWETGESKKLVNQNWIIKDNVVVGRQDSKQPVFEFAGHLQNSDLETLVGTLNSDLDMHKQEQASAKRVFAASSKTVSSKKSQTTQGLPDKRLLDRCADGKR